MVRLANRQLLRSTRRPQLLLAFAGLFFCAAKEEPISAVTDSVMIFLFYFHSFYIFIFFFWLCIRIKHAVAHVLRLMLSLPVTKTLTTYLRNFTAMNFLCVWMHNPRYSKFTAQLYLHILLLTLSGASHDCRPSRVRNGGAILWLAEKTKVWQARAERCSLGHGCPLLSRAAPDGWPVPRGRGKPWAVTPSGGLSAAKRASREECLGGGWWFTRPASRHYNQQRPWARLACPHVTQAAGLFCRPLQRSQSVSLRRSTTLHLLFLSEGAIGKQLQQLFRLMAKSARALFFALISPLLRTGSAGICSPSLHRFALAGKRVPRLGCPAGQALALPGPQRRGERGAVMAQACSRGKLWRGEVAAQPGSRQNRGMSLSSSDYLKKWR